ncbi:pseudaminic acid cytidylyltransferase [Campylobacter jejuni]|nr:pseudaminic acid cytidylyltransferase [Campylobacter jejuni]
MFFYHCFCHRRTNVEKYSAITMFTKEDVSNLSQALLDIGIKIDVDIQNAHQCYELLNQNITTLKSQGLAMKNLCIIPARGGSKRIPRKNIIDFLGKPLIAYSIENALNSGIFDEVVLSSDDEEIIEVALKYGAKAPFVRDKNLSDDYASSTAVVQNAIEILQSQNQIYDHVCCLYATAPLLNKDILKQAYEKFIRNQSKFLFAATEFEYPIQRAFYLNKNNQVYMFDEKHYKSRSQDLTKAYHDAGAFYFGTSKAWLEEDFMFKPHSSVFVLPRNLVCDIDTMQDLEFAKILYKVNHESAF